MQFYTFCARLFNALLREITDGKPGGNDTGRAITKSLLIRMKLITIIMLAGCLHLSAAGFSQQINITLKKASIESVFKAIEKQTSYTFFYRLEMLDHLDRIQVNLKNATIGQALNKALKNQPVDYQIVDNIIIIRTKGASGETPVNPINVSGTVKDGKGNTLPGVTVTVKDTKMTTVTGDDGSFKLVADQQATLIVSCIGFKTIEVPVGGRTSLNITLQDTIDQLNQVVVIGYGKQARAAVTDAITSVKAADLDKYSGSSFALQLAGKAAGVVINDASAQPGTDPQIVIRGIGTLTAGRSPLIVVDGFPLTEGSSFNSINPRDIESIDVLKDAASAAIYGSRAANGVLLITTKKGNANEPKVTFDVYSGYQERNDHVKYVDAYQAALYFTEARDNGYVSKDPANRSAADNRATRVAKGASIRELQPAYLQPYLANQPGLTNTDWLNEIFRKAPMSSYNLAISGGTGKTNYYVSGNYFNQQGLVIENSLERFSGNIKINSKISDKMSFGITANPSFIKQKYFTNDASNNTDPLGDATINYPFFAPYNADGSLAISQQIIANTPEDGALAENAVALAKKIKNNRNNFRIFGNTFFAYEPIAGLKLKTLWGADIRNYFYDFYNPSDLGAYRTAAPKPASATETNGNVTNYLIENTINYTKSFGSHNIDVLAGYTFQKENGNRLDIVGSGIPDNNVTNVAGASAFTASPSPNRYIWTQISYLARVQYSYQDKYLLSGTLRRDGSSRFGLDNQYANFPSVTAGYVLSKESFFPQNKALSFAKVRVSWGAAGNNQVGNYSSRSLVGPVNYVFGNTLAAGFAANTTPNNNLSWETRTSTDVGLDLSFFNKLNLSVDYYYSITKNLLLNVPIPEQSGFATSIQNIGKVKNTGLELELSGSNIGLGPVKWSFNANLATNKNTVLALAPGQTQIVQGSEANFYTRVGGPVAALYGYNVTGVYKSQTEINSTPHISGTVVGDYIVEDITNDGQITTDDFKSFGTYSPKFTYGFGSDFAYHNIDLSFSLTGISGRTIYDRGLSTLDESGEGFSVPNLYYFENRYHPTDNPNGTLAQPNYGNFSPARRLQRASSAFYKKADYLRLRDLQLGYTISSKLTSKLNISKVRLYVSATNLFTFTDFKGYNPDATTDNVLTNGQANANYPVARSFLLGANIKF